MAKTTEVAEKVVEGAVAASQTFTIKLELISQHYNPRDVFPTLTVEHGHEFMSLIKMALGSPEEKAEFCRLVEEYEGDDGSGEEGKLSPVRSTIVQVANSIRSRGQLQSVGVRKFGTHKVTRGGETVGQKTTYGLVYGGRRLAAVAYNHAKHGSPAVINAMVLSKCKTSQDAFDLAVEENAHRNDFTDVEWGHIIHTYNVDMGLTFEEISKKLNKHYQFVRGRNALATAEPELISKLEKREVTLTHAIKTALGENTAKKSGRPKEVRQRPLTIQQMQAMFDQTSRDNDERLETLAQCMQVSLEEELEASADRLAGKTAPKVRKVKKVRKNKNSFDLAPLHAEVAAGVGDE